MNDERMQSLLDAWYRDRDEAPRDPSGGIARVMDKVPQVRQRGRWWPLSAFDRTVSSFPSRELAPVPIPATNGRTRPRGFTMFSALKFIAASVVVALFGGILLAGVFTTQQDGDMPPGAVTESLEGAQALEPPSEFSGTLGCPDATVTGDHENLVLGPLDEGSLIRREWRGHRFTWSVEGMSDPRLDGMLTAQLNRDEYIYPGVDVDDPPALVSATIRIENEAGAWQGSGPDAYIPDGPLSTWGLTALTGEGAYEGLTATWWTNLQDPDCACWDPENQCVHDVRGALFHGEMPTTPGD